MTLTAAMRRCLEAIAKHGGPVKYDQIRGQPVSVQARTFDRCYNAGLIERAVRTWVSPTGTEFLMPNGFCLTDAGRAALTENWEQSAGARGEVEYAKQTGIPVFHTTEDLHAWTQVDKLSIKELFRCPVCGDENIDLGGTNKPGVVYWRCGQHRDKHYGGFASTALAALILWHEATKADKILQHEKNKAQEKVDTTHGGTDDRRT